MRNGWESDIFGDIVESRVVLDPVIFGRKWDLMHWYIVTALNAADYALNRNRSGKSTSMQMVDGSQPLRTQMR
jgi:hypothetical protein